MMITVYLLTFFNTAILIIMLNANFNESSNGVLKFLFSAGKRADWDTEWYS